MQIVLYKNASEPNTINKTISNALTLSGVLREESSISKPTFRICSNSDISQYNYCYIPEFGRYYFISEIVIERTGIWNISTKCDVLESFKNKILDLEAVIGRQENEFNLYFSDPEWKVYENDHVMTRDFPSGFDNTGTYYLTVAGGYQSLENISQ